jgi:hypothetical protein
MDIGMFPSKSGIDAVDLKENAVMKGKPATSNYRLRLVALIARREIAIQPTAASDTTGNRRWADCRCGLQMVLSLFGFWGFPTGSVTLSGTS